MRDEDTEAIWHRRRSRKLDLSLQRAAWRKLAMLDAAETLADLAVPPGNRLQNSLSCLIFIWTHFRP